MVEQSIGSHRSPFDGDRRLFARPVEPSRQDLSTMEEYLAMKAACKVGEDTPRNNVIREGKGII